MSTVTRTGRLAQLSRYYLSCLARDENRDISEFSSSKRDQPAYAELSEIPLFSGPSISGWSEPAVAQFLERFRRERHQQALYLGYPVNLVYVEARSGWRGFRVEPIFVFEVRYEPASSQPSLDDLRPEINLSALKRLTNVDATTLMDEALAIQSDIVLDDEAPSSNDIALAIQRIVDARPEWPWREQIDPFDVRGDLPLAAIGTGGIYNRAILLKSEHSRFTRGLVRELQELANIDERNYKGTALDRWVNPHTSAETDHSTRATLLEPFPLNNEQRTAVQSALSNSLTVVTGPPGTGKSQVVASIVANCAWRGEKVLVASRNHKAVDVVEERVNTFGPRPLLLRLGPNKYQSRLAEYFSTLLSASSDSEDEAAYHRSLQQYDKLIRDRSDSLDELHTVIDIRNTLDELEQGLEEVRDAAGNEVFQAMRHVDLESATKTIDRAMRLARRATREWQGFFTRLLWPFLRAGRVQDAKAIVPEVDSLNEKLSVPPVPSVQDDGAPMLRSLEELSTLLEFAPRVQHYFTVLARLNDLPSPPEVTRKLMDLNTRLQSTSARLWEQWLQIQPAKLSPEDRRLLGNYKALLEMKISADENGQLMGNEAFRDFMKTFPKLANLLPAWAVTNLSARGRLPFEAGYFDLVVIDEASQCDIASALPLLYRSKRAVIIGDPKQLRHITQINDSTNQSLMQQHGIYEIGAAWSYPSNSLYDLAASLLGHPTVHLRDHHRSDAQIIGFSNEHFYEGRLRIATHHRDLIRPETSETAIRWIDVKGQVRRPASGSAINRDEATTLVMELERILVDAEYSGSVGVVTPFRAQANFIRELVHANDRIMNTIGSSNLLIDTVYKFQGDERDVMFFSPVVSSNTPRSTLGFLEKNANTFNVAVTRARAALIVVGDQSACAMSDVRHLEAFAHYVANNVAATPNQDVVDAMESSPEYPPVSNPEQVSDWERWFYTVLYANGLRPVPQYSVEQYILDFALFNGERRLAIEIDGEHFHRAWTGELIRQDQIRNARLIELGWDVMRFWIYQIRDDTNTCVEQIMEWFHDPTAAK